MRKLFLSILVLISSLGFSLEALAMNLIGNFQNTEGSVFKNVVLYDLESNSGRATAVVVYPSALPGKSYDTLKNMHFGTWEKTGENKIKLTFDRNKLEYHQGYENLIEKKVYDMVQSYMAEVNLQGSPMALKVVSANASHVDKAIMSSYRSVDQVDTDWNDDCLLEPGAPIYAYNVDANTSFSRPRGQNIAMVKMVKPNYTEEYAIQFFKDYFVVLNVYATDNDRTEALQSEVGVKQSYDPNPRVNACFTAMQSMLPYTVANTYPVSFAADKEAAESELKKYLYHSIDERQISLFRQGNVAYVDTYSGKNIPLTHIFHLLDKASNEALAEFHVSEYGDIHERDMEKEDNIFVK